MASLGPQCSPASTESPVCYSQGHWISPRLPYSPLSILTATVLAWSGRTGSIPKASAHTTCPKQPSPRGFPRTSLEMREMRPQPSGHHSCPESDPHPHSAPHTCPGGTPTVGREVGLDSRGPQARGGRWRRDGHPAPGMSLTWPRSLTPGRTAK